MHSFSMELSGTTQKNYVITLNYIISDYIISIVDLYAVTHKGRLCKRFVTI